MVGTLSIVRGRKALPAFCSSPFEHKLSTLSTHTHPEAVRLCSAAIVRLKSPFHDLHLSINFTTQNGKPIESNAGCQGQALSAGVPGQHCEPHSGAASQTFIGHLQDLDPATSVVSISSTPDFIRLGLVIASAGETPPGLS
jgi:hypothetical protein